MAILIHPYVPNNVTRSNSLLMCKYYSCFSLFLTKMVWHKFLSNILYKKYSLRVLINSADKKFTVPPSNTIDKLSSRNIFMVNQTLSGFKIFSSDPNDNYIQYDIKQSLNYFTNYTCKLRRSSMSSILKQNIRCIYIKLVIILVGFRNTWFASLRIA